LKALGLSDAQAETIKQKIIADNVERSLKIIKISGANNVQVKIELSFANDTNEETLKVVEIIPKELVDSAKKIFSDTNFRIIKEDPIIEFTVPAKKGAKTTISYNIGEMSEENANKLIEGNVLQKFSTPPLLLQAGDEPEKLIASAVGIISMETLQLLAIIGVLLFAILVVVIIFITKYSPPKSAMGEKKTRAEQQKPKEVPEPRKLETPENKPQ